MSESVSESVTRSPIELLWTAKNILSTNLFRVAGIFSIIVCRNKCTIGLTRDQVVLHEEEKNKNGTFKNIWNYIWNLRVREMTRVSL